MKKFNFHANADRRQRLNAAPALLLKQLQHLKAEEFCDVHEQFKQFDSQ
ncbi:hypothetical protein ACTXJ5_14140 [Psychrobacter alimentarius]